MEKERLYLTDITLHMREFRQTMRFSKVAHKGRMYSPMPKSQGQTKGTTMSPDGTFHFAIKLPPDLQEKLDRGEIEIMVPQGGLPVFAGRDVYEFIESQKQKERRQLIHYGRAWHAE